MPERKEAWLYVICSLLWFKINMVPSLDCSSARTSEKHHLTRQPRFPSGHTQGELGCVGSLDRLVTCCPPSMASFHVFVQHSFNEHVGKNIFY